MQTNITCMCGECSVFQLHWVCPGSWRVCFHGLHFSGSRLLCRELSVLDPGLCAFPKSKPLRFRYSTKAQTRLGLRFVPFPGPNSSCDQVLGEHSHPQVWDVSYHLPCPSRSVFSVYNGCAFSGLPCVSSGELISDCNPPGRCQPSRIQGRLG